MADGAEYDSHLKNKLIKVIKIDTVNFEVPSSVKEIVGGSVYDSAFYPCASNIKNVRFGIGSQLTTLGNYLFSETSLYSIDFSPCTKLTKLSYAIFFQCHDLYDVKLPNSLEEISIGAFSHCFSLYSLKIPDNVVNISNWESGGVSGVFSNTKALREVIFSENSKLEKLGSHAFIASGLKRIFLPKSLINILSAPFLDSDLEEVIISPENPKFKSDGHVITHGDEIVTVAPGYSGSYTISENAQFGYQAFRGSHISSFSFAADKNYAFSQYCFSTTKVKSFSIPNSVTTISKFCFSDSALETITLPKSLQTIGDQSFLRCVNLSKVILPEGLQTIKELAFYGNANLKRIEIPSTVTEYGEGIFGNCHPDIEIIFKNANRFKPDNGDSKLIIFNGQKVVEYIGNDSNYEVKFPSNCNFIGKCLFYGKRLRKITFTNPKTAMTIGDEAFKESTIQEISFPSGTTLIGINCFENSTSLKSVVIDGTLNTISKRCFNGCELLEKVTFKSTSVTIIGDYAFNLTKSLTSIDLTKLSLTSIGECAFQLSGIKTAVLPSTVKDIGSSAFRETPVTHFSCKSNILYFPPYLLYEATELENVEIGPKVVEIRNNCFEGCIKLVHVTLSPATEVIDMYAFSRCDMLSYVTIPAQSNLKLIRPFAFDGSMNFNKFEILDSKYSFDNRCLMDNKKTQIIYYMQVSRAKSFIVPGTVQIINMYAFHNCKFLREIIIADGTITEIGTNAFEGCSNLKRLVLPKSLQKIGADAFKGCTSLGCGSVTIEEKLIPQAIAAMINEVALETQCINNDEYVQYGKYTCEKPDFLTGRLSFLFFVQLCVFA